MKQSVKIGIVIMLFWFSLQAGAAVPVVDGVSHELAEYRAAHVRDVRYYLEFTIPADRNKAVSFFETLRFSWTGDEDLQIDFQGTASQLDASIMVNGKRVKTVLLNEHIVVPAAYLRMGENKILIGGESGDKALNRNADYLYTLFVPDHARSVFPCFDQPDLKARFDLELDLPEGWVSLTNETQKPIPTYLFSFVAGNFQVQTAYRSGRLLTALYRETDSAKVAQLPTIFDQVALSLSWMERYTGVSYPFEHYAFVVLPGYQFGGMEHPGCIQFTDKRIFLAPNATIDDEMSRLNLIAHETAHMWFGDLVTMRWFDDVWTKEVFANFMADKIAREQFPDLNHDLAFIKAHYPLALSTDRTLGSHPIQQPLENLNQAGLLYGNIIYHKAPIMMRQLEQEKGVEALRQGLKAYLQRYAYGNATWDDLIAELDRFAPEHSARFFSDVWVKQKGLPTVSCTRTGDNSCEIIQQDPYGRGLTWRQGFENGLVTHGNIQGESLLMTQDRVSVSVPAGADVILNYTGLGYGRFVIDEQVLPILAEAWKTMPDDINRYAAVMNLYENFHMGNITADALFDIFYALLEHEQGELIASTLCSDIISLLPHLDKSRRPEAERQLLGTADRHELQSVRQTLLRRLSAVAVAPEVIDALYTRWVEGTPLLSERDRMTLAYHLAIMKPERWEKILETQRARLKTDDERREFDFISRACNPDTQVQQQLFNELLQAENRRVEPWARQMLALLNDPSREPFSNCYLEPGLDALEDVQRTGDIFFPGYWLSALLTGHQSDEAKRLVHQWIDQHPDLNSALMNKLKESAYWLLR